MLSKQSLCLLLRTIWFPYKSAEFGRARYDSFYLAGIHANILKTSARICLPESFWRLPESVYRLPMECLMVWLCRLLLVWIDAEQDLAGNYGFEHFNDMESMSVAKVCRNWWQISVYGFPAASVILLRLMKCLSHVRIREGLTRYMLPILA